MIKPLNHHDFFVASLIHELSMIAYKVEAELLGIESFPPLNEKIVDIKNSTSSFAGYYENDNLIGVIELENGSDITINRLVVHPSSFRKNVATKLLDSIMIKGTKFTVVTATKNQPAVKLYRRIGFKLVNTFIEDNGLELSKFRIQT